MNKQEKLDILYKAKTVIEDEPVENSLLIANWIQNLINFVEENEDEIR